MNTEKIEREYSILSHLSDSAYKRCVQLANDMSLKSGKSFNECLTFLAKSSLKEYNDTVERKEISTPSNTQLRIKGFKKKNHYSKKLMAKFVKQNKK